MRLPLIFSVLIVSLGLIYTNMSFAACGGGPTVFTCDTTPPNPDPIGVQEEDNLSNLTVNVLDGAGIERTADTKNCINTGDGMDEVNIDGGDLTCGGDSIRTRADNDIINVTNSTLTNSDDCAHTDAGDDIVNFTDVVCIRGTEGLELGSGNDTVNILRSQILCGDFDPTCQEAIEASNDDDNITIVESILRNDTQDVIDMGSGNDTLTLGNGADTGGGLLDCGPDTDTIVFAMQVPTSSLDTIAAQIESENPASGSITINRLFYEWEDCEELVAQLEPGLISPVPTLSQWGLIATAGLLGIIGFIVIRRRQSITNS